MRERRSRSFCRSRSLFEIRSIFQPVSLAASRAFWPPFPMASDSWSSATETRTFWSLSTICASSTFAGDSERVTKTTGSWLQGTMSIFSPPSSRTIACTRDPLMPTHAPTASILSSLDTTETLARDPGSRAMPLISMIFSATSGTSASKRRRRNSGCVRERMICGPRASLSTAMM